MKKAVAETEQPTAVDIAAIINLADIDERANVRRTYDKAGIESLAKSIGEKGLIQPVLVTPRGARFLLVAGYRRKRAFELNKATTIPAYIRDLTDDEVENLQGIENLQRVDLPPLDEAQLYEDMVKIMGKTVADCARISGRSPSHIVKRRGLLHLAKPVREALAKSSITVGIAELLGRIPDEKLQTEALGAMYTAPRGGTDFDRDLNQWVKVEPRLLTEKEAAKLIERYFMLDVAKAPFDPKDASLSPLGSCVTCEFLTGNSRDLFGDVANESFCTNPADYERKVANWLARQSETGVKVLGPKDAKKVWPSEDNPRHMSNEWVNLDDEQWLGNKKRKRMSILNAEQKKDVVLAWSFGRVWHIMPAGVWLSAAKANGMTDTSTSGGRGEPRTKSKEEVDREYKDRTEKAIQKEVSTALVALVGGKQGKVAKIGFDEWVTILARIIILEHGWRIDDVLPRHQPDTGEPVKKKKLGVEGGRKKMADELLTTMTTNQKMAFILDVLTYNWNTGNAGFEKQHMFLETAKFLGVDVEAIVSRMKIEFRLKRQARDERDDKKNAATAKKAGAAPAASATNKGRKKAVEMKDLQRTAKRVLKKRQAKAKAKKKAS